MIEKGELDWAENVTKDSLPALKRNAALTVYEKAGTTLMVTFLNTQAGADEGPPGAAGAASPLEPGGLQRHRGPHGQRRPAVHADARAGLEDGEPVPVQPGARQAAPRRGRLIRTAASQLRYQSQKGDVDKRAMFEIFQAELNKLNVTVELFDDTWPALVKRATDWGATRDAGTAVHLFGYFRPMFIPTPYDFLFHMYHSEAYPDEGRPELHLLLEPRVRQAHQRGDGDARSPTARAALELRQAAELVWRTRPSWSTGASSTSSSPART